MVGGGGKGVSYPRIPTPFPTGAKSKERPRVTCVRLIYAPRLVLEALLDKLVNVLKDVTI